MIMMLFLRAISDMLRLASFLVFTLTMSCFGPLMMPSMKSFARLSYMLTSKSGLTTISEYNPD